VPDAVVFEPALVSDAVVLEPALVPEAVPDTAPAPVVVVPLADVAAKRSG
jgi:hypothetical protein